MSLFQVALVGRPNVGKSSLFNALLGFRRSIVLDMPGTTLDEVAEKVDWGKGPFQMSDSFGVQDDADREGFIRVLKKSDACLFVVDALSGPMSFDRELARVAGALAQHGRANLGWRHAGAWHVGGRDGARG